TTEATDGAGATATLLLLLASPDDCASIADAYAELLTSERDSEVEADLPGRPTTALPVPLSSASSPAASRLLSLAYSSAPLSKSVLLSSNSLLVNRDGGLFDNLPWSRWSADPDRNERDAAGNVAEAKYALGKRVAYQRFAGKDWQGRSLSLGNLANRVRFWLEGEGGDEDEGDDSNGSSAAGDEAGRLEGSGLWKDEEAMMSLSMRLLELEIEEATMDVAECDKRLAVARNRPLGCDEGGEERDEEETDDVGAALERLEVARMRLLDAEGSLDELTTALESTKEEVEGKSPKRTLGSVLSPLLAKLAEQETPPPYRGAIGYPAKLDTKEEVFDDSVLPYASPYELLLEIVDEQLNSEVVGCVLEPASLLEENLVLGGAILLERKGVTKSATIAGEEVSYEDDDDDLGNEGVLPRSMYVAECFADEAAGVALAAGKAVYVEGKIRERAGRVPLELDVERAREVRDDAGASGVVSYANRVPPLRPADGYPFTIQLEGERVSTDEEANAIRIPLTTNPEVFGGPDQVPGQSSRTSEGPTFSTFNPVTSLDEYDALSDDAKVRLLLKLESFTGRLPRPRAVRAARAGAGASAYRDGGSPPSILDEILLPLVDESVRRQYRIRDAERRGDLAEAEALRAEASPRQAALERARAAREGGFEAEADEFDDEADLYESLRADVTQDEGAYGRFLDRDEWYEREARERRKKVDKSKFGTLLDGIDLP
ncbi:hypothetical protein ACHAWF_008606, partial [Thalassiosira exigua]